MKLLFNIDKEDTEPMLKLLYGLLKARYEPDTDTVFSKFDFEWMFNRQIQSSDNLAFLKERTLNSSIQRVIIGLNDKEI